MKRIVINSFMLIAALFAEYNIQAYSREDEKAFEKITSVGRLDIMKAVVINSQKKQLNALGAYMVNAAIDRALELLTDDAFAAIAKRAKEKLGLLRAQAVDPLQARSANNYAVSMFNSQIQADEQRLGTVVVESKGRGPIIGLRGEIIAPDFREHLASDPVIRQLLSAEFDVLNERYAKVMSALKKLTKQTVLPDFISLEAIVRLAK